MNRLGIVFLSLIVASMALGRAEAQNVALQVVNNDYPNLMELYRQKGDALGNQKAHHIFAIDVSTFMRKNINEIRPQINDFIMALPDGDQVTLIRKSSTDKTDYVGGVVNLEINSESRQTLRNILTSDAFAVQDAGSDGYTMTSKILDAIMNPMSEGLVFVFMFTDFEYWTSANGYDKSKEDWEALKTKFKPFIDLTSGDQSRVVLPYAFYYRDNDYRAASDYRPELESIFGCKLNQPPTGDAVILRNFFNKMETNALVFRLKYLIYQDLAKTNVTSALSLSDNKEILMTTDLDGLQIFDNYTYDITNEPECLEKAFVRQNNAELAFGNGAALYNFNNKYSPLLPHWTILHGKMAYTIHPVCKTNLAVELDKLNALDESLVLDYKRPYDLEAQLPSGWFYSHILPAWVGIALVLLLLAYGICWLITLLLNKFGKIYRTWNIIATTDDGENQETFSHSFPKAKKVTVSPSTLGIPNGGSWKFDIITVDGPIYRLWHQRGYYIRRGCPMNIERKGKTKALPNKEYRVTPLKKWGQGCKLKFKNDNMDYVVKIQ